MVHNNGRNEISFEAGNDERRAVYADPGIEQHVIHGCGTDEWSDVFLRGDGGGCEFGKREFCAGERETGSGVCVGGASERERESG